MCVYIYIYIHMCVCVYIYKVITLYTLNLVYSIYHYISITLKETKKTNQLLPMSCLPSSLSYYCILFFTT